MKVTTKAFLPNGEPKCYKAQFKSFGFNEDQTNFRVAWLSYAEIKHSDWLL